MVSYILITQNGPIFTYEYYPNGEKNLKGSFSINKDTKEILDIHLSQWEYWDEEKQDGNRKYFIKVVERVLKKDTKEGYVAWG